MHVHKPAGRSYAAAAMANLLSLLRDEALKLVESELPSPEEIGQLVGAVVKRLERLEQDLVGELKPAPEPDPVVQPAAQAVAPGPPTPSEVSPPAEPAVSPSDQAPPTGPGQPASDVGATPEADLARQAQLQQAQQDLAAAQARVDELETSS